MVAYVAFLCNRIGCGRERVRVRFDGERKGKANVAGTACAYIPHALRRRPGENHRLPDQ
jgi:hypothetical protein